MKISDHLHTGLVDFIYHEADLLDDGQYTEWLNLFAEDGYYWIPSAPEQASPSTCSSHVYDDALMRQLRVDRLGNARAYSQQPPSRCHHLLQRPRVQPMSEGKNLYVAHTKFSYTEYSTDESQTLVGTLVHHLQAEEGNFKIKLKRVNIVNCDAPLSAVQLFI